MREVDIAFGWELVLSPQLNPLNNPACLLHWRVLLTTLQWLDITQQGAVREYRPVLPGVRGGVPPGSALTPQQKPEKSRLVREEAGQESPVAASQKPEKSRLVLEEASDGSPVAASQKPEMPLVQGVPVADSQEPVVLRERSWCSEECPVATPQEKLRVTRIS